MQPQPAAPGFGLLFVGVPEDVEYYVEAGGIKSRHFQDPHRRSAGGEEHPVTYNYPSWTGLHVDT